MEPKTRPPLAKGKHNAKGCGVCKELKALKEASREKLIDWVLNAEHDRDWQKLKRREAEAERDALLAANLLGGKVRLPRTRYPGIYPIGHASGWLDYEARLKELNPQIRRKS